MADTLALTNVGPLKKAEIQFGDLTVLVGPQATGKSIFLQFLKLMLDSGPVKGTLGRYGLDWVGSLALFSNLYFGEGMSQIWKDDSLLEWRGQSVDLAKLVRPDRSRSEEKCFFIPAQRVLAMSRESWLRPFEAYKA